MSGIFIVATYDCDQMYGGPEEGGWWYEAGSLVRIHRVYRNLDVAYQYCRRLNARLHSRAFGPNKGKPDFHSVLSEGQISAHIFDDCAPRGFPEQRPHYE